MVLAALTHKNTTKEVSQRCWSALRGGYFAEEGSLPSIRRSGATKTGWRVSRRSVATALSEMREPVRTTQLVLGHSSPQTTLAFYVQSVVAEIVRGDGRPCALQFRELGGPFFANGTLLQRRNTSQTARSRRRPTVERYPKCYAVFTVLTSPSFP